MSLIDQDRIRWPGSGSLVSGSTAFGTYDNDIDFQQECYSAAIWAGRRLGYPNSDVELVDVHFYTAFEEAVNEWQNQINQYNIINNLSTYQGQTITEVGNASIRNVQGSSLNYIVQLSKAYGTEVGVGGNIDWKRGYITTSYAQQTYDLQALWGDVSESFNRIEIRRVFNERAPAISRIFDPYNLGGVGTTNLLGEMGFAGFSPAVQFLMCPIFEDLLRVQAIEFNDMVRKSQYSFEIVNNKLKLFPIPTTSMKVYFDYCLLKDMGNGTISNAPTGSASIVTDFSNIPYNNQPYSSLNDSARQWIRKYFLAICKQILGGIRQKVQSIPIPGGEITLDGAELRNEATQEMENLITQLRENLTEAGKRKQIEAQAAQSEQMNTVLRGVPLFIYIA